MALGKRIAVLTRQMPDGPDLLDLLGARGFQAFQVSSEDELADVIVYSQPDIALILGSPDASNLPRLTAMSQATARTLLMVVWPGVHVQQAVGLLEIGVDYVAPSYQPDWLAAQMRASLRRLGQERAAPTIIDLGYLRIDLEQRRVEINQRPVSLTPTEFSVLRILAERPGTVLPSGEIMQQILGVRIPESEAQDLLKVHIHRLRQKLEQDLDHPRFIRTVRGHGYMYAFERRAKGRDATASGEATAADLG
ncbi:MAG: winged helix-turn-helix transcriptional regulator [Chloroflexota bacterium]